MSLGESDLAAHAAAVSLIRRRYKLGRRGIRYDEPLLARDTGIVGVQFDVDEVAILAGTKDNANASPEFLLTTRSAIAFSKIGVHHGRYDDIVSWDIMPFPRTPFGELFRLKLHLRDGSVFFLEGEPGGTFNAALAVIANRVKKKDDQVASRSATHIFFC